MNDYASGSGMPPAELPTMLRHQARAWGERTAVLADGEALTFAELTARAEGVGRRLAGLGAAPDDRVGIFLEPSADLMVGVWGVLFAGAAYLPLPADYPDDRLRSMMADAEARIVLTHARLTARLRRVAPHGTTVVALDESAENGSDCWSEYESGNEEAPRRAVAPNHLAYVIYTSGSTGQPKGVMIEHRSIASQMRWLADAYGLGHDAAILQKTPLGFDAAQWEVLAVATGATVVMGTPGIHRDPEGMVEAVVQHGVTFLQCVPTILQALLDTGRLPECTSLRRLFSGGEALSRTLAKRLLEELPDCELVNLYGPTECTINSSAHTVDRASIDAGPPTISIGLPVRGTSYHVIDGSGRPCVAGEVGELHVGGVQLARGYLNRPELTAEKFVKNRFHRRAGGRLYRTGDLASWNQDGTVQFIGRADNQVKIRGMRVELDEIRLAIEEHTWVRHAAVVIAADRLIAYVELDSREAALMDQGSHGAHHQSKESRLQVRAQLSEPGCRDDAELAGRPVIALPGADATSEQRRLVFARKTYRYFEGGTITRDDVLQLLKVSNSDAISPRALRDLSFEEFGGLLRYFGSHRSDERLLPKYGYASPGALYATQVYIELSGLWNLEAGFYYFHPVRHELVRVGSTGDGGGEPLARLHFVGKHSAIKPVYTKNVQEVLEIETGHILGLFDHVLPRYGLRVAAHGHDHDVREHLDVAEDDMYLGAFDLLPGTVGDEAADPVDLYVQINSGGALDLAAGHYRHADGDLMWISDDLVEKKHVIAINQEVYDRAGLGVTVLSHTPEEWLRYIALGRALQRLSLNNAGFGFMSSGYSSKTGDDLPSARRIEAILTAAGLPTAPSYFAVGGRVSPEQALSEGMKEDSVHMRGPAEMIRDDLARSLPDAMVPNRVWILDRLPVTPHGKIDLRALTRRAADDALAFDDRLIVAPRTKIERAVAEIWNAALRLDDVSVHEDFFTLGGNSLIAVALVRRMNRELGTSLPLQVLFEAPTIELLAQRAEHAGAPAASRLVRLSPGGLNPPVHCWPGLGGYPMNLRALAARIGIDRPVFGVQAFGVNEGEDAYRTVAEMAAADVELIRQVQPSGPYTLCGYSFGARVAFESARLLESSGEQVENLFLIAPGSPQIEESSPSGSRDQPSYTDPAYVTILFSVFAGAIHHPALAECLARARDDESFASFICGQFDNLERTEVLRITEVVRRTYEAKYRFRELTGRPLQAPITVLRARGDDYSFLDSHAGYSSSPPTIVDIEADHYALLHEPHVALVAQAVGLRLPPRLAGPRMPARIPTKENPMPHVNIKFFPTPLDEQQQVDLVAAVTAAVREAFRCDEGVISIALEPVEADVWNERVYIPEIVERRSLLHKTPNY